MSDSIEYDALNFDGLERRGNYRFIAFREDMLHALDKKDAAALLYQIVYRWQVEYKKEEVLKKIEARKKSGQKPYTQQEIEEMMFVYMSYNDFVRETGGAVGYNTVIRTIDYLVNDMKALKQKENHDPKYPDYEYSVNKEVVRELLKALPVQPPFAPKIPKKKNSSTQMGTPDDKSTQMGTDSTHLGIRYTQMGTGVYPNGGTSQEHTGNTQDHTEEESNSATSQSLETSASNDAIYTFLEEMKKRLEAVEQDNHSLRASNQSLQAELSTAREQLSTLVEKPNNQTDTEANNETSYSHPATQSEQPVLFPVEKPEHPQMPPASMKWSAEKMVQITEAKRYCNDKQGAYFSETLKGKSKKTQRERQLEAAKKIIGLGISEEEYIKAYDNRNDTWWNNRCSLTVEDMYAKTTKGVIRIIEVLEGLESKSDTTPTKNNIRQFPANQVRKTASRSMDEQASIEEMTNRMLDEDVQAQQLAKLFARAEEKRAMALAK